MEGGEGRGEVQFDSSTGTAKYKFAVLLGRKTYDGNPCMKISCIKVKYVENPMYQSPMCVTEKFGNIPKLKRLHCDSASVLNKTGKTKH